MFLFQLFKGLKPYKNLNSEEFKEAIKSDHSAVVIDVRTAGEYKSGKIRSAKNIDVNSSSFRQAIKDLPKEKNYYIYCRSGGRSAMACRAMAKEGFKNLFNLSGGMLSWKGEISK